MNALATYWKARALAAGETADRIIAADPSFPIVANTVEAITRDEYRRFEAEWTDHARTFGRYTGREIR